MGSFGEKVEEDLVNLVGVGPAHAVWGAADDFEATAGDHLVGAAAADLERNDPVCVAVDNEGGDGDRGQVVTEVGVAERVDQLPGADRGTRSGDVPAQLHGRVGNASATENIGVV